MIPLKDEIPTRRTPVVNYLLIAANILVFLVMWLAGPEVETIFNRYALIPAHFTDGITLADIITIFTSMFMHAGLAHIGGNMLYLWIFGDNVEDRLGSGRYLIFYLVGGVVASLTQFLINPASEIPTVGASGAIAAVLGAYLVLFPASQIVTYIPLGRFARIQTVPAILVLGMWFVLQLFDGVLSLGSSDVGGVAFWAHIGGFVAGMLMAMLFAPKSSSQSAATW